MSDSNSGGSSPDRDVRRRYRGSQARPLKKVSLLCLALRGDGQSTQRREWPNDIYEASALLIGGSRLRCPVRRIALRSLRRCGVALDMVQGGFQTRTD